jgi:hypothetical protein
MKQALSGTSLTCVCPTRHFAGPSGPPTFPGASGVVTFQNLILVSAMATVVGVYWGERYSSGVILTLMCLLRALQILFHLTTNPIFLLNGPEDARTTGLQAAFVQSVHFSWSTPSMEVFLWMHEELIETLERLQETSSYKYIDANVSKLALHRQSQGNYNGDLQLMVPRL